MYGVQLLILFSVVVSAMGFHPLRTKEIKAAKSACYTDLKIDPKTRFNDTDPQFKCYSQCIINKLNVVDDKGALITNNIPDNLQKYASLCAGANKIDTCESATTFGKCMKKEIKAHLKSIEISCAAETKTNLDLKECSFKNFLPKLYNDTMACYNRCLMIKTQAINEQNEANVKLLEKYVVVDNFNLAETVKTCNAETQETDKCLQAVYRARCIGSKMVAKKLAE